MTGVPDGLALPLPGGLLLLGGRGTRVVAAALALAERIAARDGIAPPADWVAVRAAVTAAASDSGSAEVPAPPVVAASRVVVMDPVSTVEAAEMLGCTARNVRDLCARGAFAASRLGGRWVLEREEVTARGSSSPRAVTSTGKGTG